MEAGPVLQLARSNGAEHAKGGAPFLLGPYELTIRITGMGPQPARAAALQALQPWTRGSNSGVSSATPDVVLVIGLCGGLTQGIPACRIVAYARCLTTASNLPPVECSGPVSRRLQDLLRSKGISCDSVSGITSARIAVTPADRIELAKPGADVVDMESYDILDAAAHAGVPTAVLRVVGDTVNETLPDFNQALSPEGALDARKALRVAMRSPLRTIRLLRSNRCALAELSGALAAVLGQDWFPG